MTHKRSDELRYYISFISLGNKKRSHRDIGQVNKVDA